MDIIQHEVMEEEGTKELIKLTKAALNTKLDSDDANISNGTITIKGTSITPISEVPSATTTTPGIVCVDDELDDTSTNPVQNRAISSELSTVSSALSDIDTSLENIDTSLTSITSSVNELIASFEDLGAQEIDEIWGSQSNTSNAPAGITSFVTNSTMVGIGGATTLVEE